ncbi:hypothetical protein F4679DRAFT_574403 [Xylaria curta]|nr:hypothetical protein F4679DRAFT_574403 [Xylaria curta]
MTGTGVLNLEGMNDIYDVVIECTRLFESPMKRKIPDSGGDTRDRDVSRRRTEEMGRSFNLRIDYIGALAADVSRSLDTPLYDHGDIKEMVIELLQMLARNLQYRASVRGDDGATGAIQKVLDELHFIATAIRRSSVSSQEYNLSSHFHRDNDIRDHMDEDAKPYVCLSEECTSPLLFLVNMKQWIDHMKSFHSDQRNRKTHMSDWYCDIGHETALQFNDRNSFLRHMKDPAKDEYCCPICDCVTNTLKPVIAASDPAEIRKRLYEHIAAHIKDPAYKSVPALDNLELD